MQQPISSCNFYPLPTDSISTYVAQTSVLEILWIFRTGIQDMFKEQYILPHHFVNSVICGVHQMCNFKKAIQFWPKMWYCRWTDLNFGISVQINFGCFKYPINPSSPTVVPVKELALRLNTIFIELFLFEIMLCFD